MAEINYISSASVRMFPSSKRSDFLDRNAKLNSEQNLISTVNRLTGKTAFVIDGLKVSGNQMTAGSCNINGYLFNLETFAIPFTANSKNNGNYLCLQISLMKGTTFTELVCADTSETSSLLDATDSTIFKGLGITLVPKANFLDKSESTNTTTGVGYTTYYLPIAECKETSLGSKIYQWADILSNDGWGSREKVDERHRWNTLKIKASDIQVDGIEGAGLDTGNYYTERQDLATFLRTNYVLDDGEIN